MNSVSRRDALGALIAAPLVASITSPPGLLHADVPRRFVLVHGAWHGGWCWKKLRPYLAADGHEVHTPTLTGLGERAHLLSADVGLDTHVQDIVAMLDSEDLSDVILVGHSYGGMVISGVAQRAAPRLRQLIFLDAFMPDPGRALSDYTRPANAAPSPSSTVTPPPVRDWRVAPRSTAQEFGVRDSVDVAWAQPRLSPQSAKTFSQPLPSQPPIPDTLKRAYVHCTHDAWFDEAATRAAQRGYPTRTLFGNGHDVMISAPKQLATLLLELTAN